MNQDNQNDSMKVATSSRPLRLWPAVALLVILWLMRMVPAMVEVNSISVFMASVFGPVACALLILVWWGLLSRASLREKLIGVLGAISIAVVSSVLAHKSLQGFGTMMFIIPWGITAFAGAMVLAHRLSPPLRTAIALLAAVIGFGYWDLIRMDGVWGDFRSSRSWRWSPTSEDLFLASLESRAEAGDLAASDAESVQIGDAAWPSFRGPARDGVQPGVTLDEDWQTHAPTELWRIKCGPGWSSFSVAGDRLFTQEQRGENEVVVCYAAETGAELWTAAYPSRFWEAVAGSGPRATPTFHAGKVYALGAEGLLHRIDAAAGTVEWQQDLRDIRPKPPTWGFASSPLIVNGVVIVHAGGEKDEGIIAYDAETGERQWCAPSGDHSYSSPQILTINDAPQLMMICNNGLSAYDPSSGGLLWKHEWKYEGYRVVQPLLFNSSSILIGTGLGTGTRRIDLSFDDDQVNIAERWTSRDMKPDYNDYVVYDGNLYGFDRNIFASINLETGQRNWKKGRYGNGQVLLLPDAGQLLVLSETGELVLLRANPERLEEVARLQVLTGKTWNHPVLIGDRLYVRNGEEAACFVMPLQ